MNENEKIEDIDIPFTQTFDLDNLPEKEDYSFQLEFSGNLGELYEHFMGRIRQYHPKYPEDKGFFRNLRRLLEKLKIIDYKLHNADYYMFDMACDETYNKWEEFIEMKGLSHRFHNSFYPDDYRSNNRRSRKEYHKLSKEFEKWRKKGFKNKNKMLEELERVKIE